MVVADLGICTAFTHGSYKKQLKNPEVTEYVEIEGRGHSLILDHGWPDVANPRTHLHQTIPIRRVQPNSAPMQVRAAGR
jgi:hypothetical protein